MDFWGSLWTFEEPILEKVIRSILIYFFLLVALRLGGKRELGQTNNFDLVVLLVISNTVQNAIIGNDNSLIGGITGATTLLITNYLVVRIAYQFPKFRKLTQGKSRLLIQEGRVIEKNLRAEAITEQELLTSLRRQGIESLSEVKSACLETDGDLTIERLNLGNDPQKEIIDRLNQIETALNQVIQRIK